MQTQLTIEPLPWDSSVFGYAVGRADCGKSPSMEMLETLKREGARNGFRLVYCRWDGPPCVTDGKSAWFSYCGGHRLYVLGRNGLMRAIGDTQGIAVCRRNTPALQRLAMESGVFSRFALDSNFANNEFSVLYRHWLENAFDRERGGVCCIAGTPDHPMGFLTLEMACDSQRMDIGLLAVHADFRRSGIGTRLLDFARKLAFEAGVASLSVKTQLDNAAAQALYESNGFKRGPVHSVAHVWCHLP